MPSYPFHILDEHGPCRDYPDPSQKDLDNPAFEAIWKAIKDWDLSRSRQLVITNNGSGDVVESTTRMYSGATGNDVMHILNELYGHLK